MKFSRVPQVLLLASACLTLPHQASTADVAAKPAPPAIESSLDATWAELDHSHWLADGRGDAPRKVYVFTDPNCPYCTKLWSDARPWVTSGKVQLRHLIVGILTPTSEGKAAAILGEKDPEAKLASYEASHAFSVSRMLASGQRHPTEDPSLTPVEPVPPGAQKILAANLKLMRSLGIQATPGVVFLDDQGHVATHQGLAPGQLTEVLGAK